MAGRTDIVEKDQFAFVDPSAGRGTAASTMTIWHAATLQCRQDQTEHYSQFEYMGWRSDAPCRRWRFYRG
jgi:hypothetical protein